MNYWLDLFTGTTWNEFRNTGACVTGFRERMRKASTRVRNGDIFICYMTGVQRWVGALKVIGPSDNSQNIWTQDSFPVRFEVEPLILLDAEYGVPMEQLECRVSFYQSASDRGKYKGFIRMSPNLFRNSLDAQLILDLIRDAEREPVQRPVDQKKFLRLPSYRVGRQVGEQNVLSVVTVPDSDEAEVGYEIDDLSFNDDDKSVPTSRHTEIQYSLLELGAEMGLDVWVARNDRSKVWNGRPLGNMPRLLSELPTQFNEATNRTIELIDVLWLRGNSIIAAFEVECTTSVYSGLLRMSDLVALQPNLDIKLYLVAPDERKGKVVQQILRPTFSLREKSLNEICGFLSFSNLMEKVSGIRRLGLASSLRPDFLETAAEYFQ